jgi:hypothetical protein
MEDKIKDRIKIILTEMRGEYKSYIDSGMMVADDKGALMYLHVYNLTGWMHQLNKIMDTETNT